MPLTITGFSTALFSTWVFIEEYGILFDAGDGAAAGLLAKSRKAEHIFITHADRDHVAGLMQLHQLNAREGKPTIYYPRDCGSFPALQAFLQDFDPQAGPATWRGIGSRERIEVGRDLFVESHDSGHVDKPDQVKGLGFTIVEEKRKLKSEFHGRSGDQLAALRAAHGDDHITETHSRGILGYSGDTPSLDVTRWQGIEILIHEATFLTGGESRGGHANLAQVIDAAKDLDLNALVLTHFSSRYTHQEITTAIAQLAEQAKLTFPVYAILPGEIVRNVLGCEPIVRPNGDHE